MELFDSIGEGLPHYLQPWASTAVKFQMPMILLIDFVYNSVSSIPLVHYYVVPKLMIIYNISCLYLLLYS